MNTLLASILDCISPVAKSALLIYRRRDSQWRQRLPPIIYEEEEERRRTFLPADVSLSSEHATSLVLTPLPL